MNVRDERFPLFDSLRAIAALSIFVLHLPWFAELAGGNPLRPYLQQLNVGVTVFFLISGFLLYRPFAKARYERRGRPATVPYAQRRLLRIVPAYWVALLLTVLVLGKSDQIGTAPVMSGDAFLYFGFLQVYDSDTLFGGISAAWSLCVEITFYAMLPLWALLMSRIQVRSPSHFLRTEMLGLLGMFAVGVLWIAITAPRENAGVAALGDVTLLEPWLWVLPAYLDHFALGMGLAVLSIWLQGRSGEPRAVRVVDRAPWLPWLLAAFAFFLLARVPDWFPDDAAARFLVTHQLQGLFAFALLLPAIFGDPDRGLVRRFLANRALLWVGIVSYSLYLWHAALLNSLVDAGVLDLGLIPFGIIGLIVTLAVAAASFYAVERPALRLGRRLSHRRRSQDADMRLQDLGSHERSETA